MTSIFIAGCGYVGRRVADLWQARSAEVAALARSTASAQDLASHGIQVFPGDLDRPESLVNLPLSGRFVYYFAPPPAEGENDPRMEAFCQALAAHQPVKVIYISTSGIYGDCGGALVDEKTPLRPATERAERRVAAEMALRRWEREQGGCAIVLRVPGIYGPGRLPLERIRNKVPVLRESEALPSNRIHVDDLAQICVTAAEKGKPEDIFNVSDDSDATMTDYFNAVADAAGMQRPPQISMAQAREMLSSAMVSYLSESRKLDTSRLHRDLGVELDYPDLKKGVEAILKKESKA